jgi:hypothetical protein
MVSGVGFLRGTIRKWERLAMKARRRRTSWQTVVGSEIERLEGRQLLSGAGEGSVSIPSTTSVAGQVASTTEPLVIRLSLPSQIVITGGTERNSVGIVAYDMSGLSFLSTSAGHVAISNDVDFRRVTDSPQPTEPNPRFVLTVTASRDTGRSHSSQPPADGVRQTFVVVVGNADYSGTIHPTLGSPGRDAAAVTQFFLESAKVPASQVTVLTDRPGDRVTLSSRMLLDTIRRLPADDDDLLIVFFAGHGQPGSGDWILHEGEVSAGDLSQALDDQGAGLNLVFSHSCYSGAFAQSMTSRHTVSFASTDADSVTWGSKTGASPFTRELFTNRLEHGTGLVSAFDGAATAVRERYADESAARRQSPVLHNPDAIPLPDQPWTTASPVAVESPGTIERLFKPLADLLRRLAELLAKLV